MHDCIEVRRTSTKEATVKICHLLRNAEQAPERKMNQEQLQDEGKECCHFYLRSNYTCGLQWRNAHPVGSTEPQPPASTIASYPITIKGKDHPDKTEN